MSKTDLRTWHPRYFPSGSVVVSSPGVEGGAHYRIEPPRRLDAQSDRQATARALADWLNGEVRPGLITVLFRTGHNSVLMQSGVPVLARSHTDDPITEGLLIDALVNDERPDV